MGLIGVARTHPVNPSCLPCRRRERPRGIGLRIPVQASCQHHRQPVMMASTTTRDFLDTGLLTSASRR